MNVILNENEFYNVIYEATKEVLRNITLYESTHRPLELIHRGLHPMNEASINRILSHGQQGFIVISGNRSDIYSKKDELDLTKQCDAELTEIFNNWMGQNNPMKELDVKKSDKTDEETAFIYRAQKLSTILENNYNVTDAKSVVNNASIRQQWLKVRNEWADMALLKDIKEKGYAWSKVYGGYHGTDDIVDSYEPNYIVYNHYRNNSKNYGEWQKLLDFAVEMCGKYNQDSVYAQAPNEAPIWVNKDGKVVSKQSSKNFIINSNNREKWKEQMNGQNNEKTDEFYTTNKRKKNNPHRFTAFIESKERPIGNISEAIDFENYLRVSGPSDYINRIRRTQNGEVFLYDCLKEQY